MDILYRDDRFSLMEDECLLFEADGVVYSIFDGEEINSLIFKKDDERIMGLYNSFTVSQLADCAKNRKDPISLSGKGYHLRDLFEMIEQTLKNGKNNNYDLSLMESLSKDVNEVEKPRNKKVERSIGVIFSIIFFLFLRIETWLCSVPMWATLILHFVVGLPIYWFWLTLAAWILVGAIRVLVLLFARWGRNYPQQYRENKNPYSIKGINTKNI